MKPCTFIILVFVTASSVHAQKVYWERYGDIYRANRDGSNQELVVSQAYPGDLAIDVVRGNLYWTRNCCWPVYTQTIRRAELDGSNEEDVVSCVYGCSGLDVDVVNAKLYWDEYTEAYPLCVARILRANLDGTNIEELIHFEEPQLEDGCQDLTPNAIRVDSFRHRMFWHDGNGAAIFASDNIGQQVAKLYFPTSNSLVRNLAIDRTGSRLYWAVAYNKQIRTVQYDGTNPVTLFDSPSTPSGVAIDSPGQFVFVAASDGLYRSRLDGTEWMQIGDGYYVSALTLDDPLDCNVDGIADENQLSTNDANANGYLDVCECPGDKWNDQDGDGFADCEDTCVAFGDSDGDGVQDCFDNCPFFANPDQELPRIENIEPLFSANRFLFFRSFSTNPNLAIRVTVDALPPRFLAATGQVFWVTEPTLKSELSGVVDPMYIPGEKFFWVASLACTPTYLDWSQFDKVAVYHEVIVPGGEYGIAHSTPDCQIEMPTLALKSSKHGDVNCYYDSVYGPCNSNSGIVDITDIVAVLNKFINAPVALVKARCDLKPARVNLIVDIVDVVTALDAFRGIQYEFDVPNNVCQAPTQ